MIVLALVAHRSRILAETHHPSHDRFLAAAHTILQRIPPSSSKLSYAFQDWLFHYVAHDGLVYMAVADTETGRRIPFAFLAHVQKKVRPPSLPSSFPFCYAFTSSNQLFFLSLLGDGQFLSSFEVPTASAGEEEEDATDYSSFSTTLASLVSQFNADPQAIDPIAQAKTELAGVKDIMTHNVEQILSRGERIELLMDRTDNAANQSMAFRRRAVGLRRQMWWKNTKVMGLAGFSAFVLLFILYGVFH